MSTSFREMDVRLFGDALKSALQLLPPPPTDCGALLRRPKLRVTFQHIPKTGGTTVERAIHASNATLPSERRPRLVSHDPLSKHWAERNRCLVLVRQPIDRLFSVYFYYRDVGGGENKTPEACDSACRAAAVHPAADVSQSCRSPQWLAESAPHNECMGRDSHYLSLHLHEGRNCQLRFLEHGPLPIHYNGSSPADVVGLPTHGSDAAGPIPARRRDEPGETFSSTRCAAVECRAPTNEDGDVRAVECGGAQRVRTRGGVVAATILYRSIAERHWPDMLLFYWVARHVDAMQACRMRHGRGRRPRTPPARGGPRAAARSSAAHGAAPARPPHQLRAPSS